MGIRNSCQIFSPWAGTQLWQVTRDPVWDLSVPARGLKYDTRGVLQPSGSCWSPVVQAWRRMSPVSQGRARAWLHWLMHRCSCSSLFWTQMPVSILGTIMIGSNLYFCVPDKSRWCSFLLPGWELSSAASQSEALYLLGTVYIIVIKKCNKEACSMLYITDLFTLFYFILGEQHLPESSSEIDCALLPCCHCTYS